MYEPSSMSRTGNGRASRTVMSERTFETALASFQSVRQINPVRPSTMAAHHEAVDRVVRVMRTKLVEPLKLQEMSRIAYVSPFHFNRMFREITGIPPNQFLYALRLETAKRLLLTTNTSVTDVCFDVGYNSLGTFIRRFTGLVGVSPSRFRALGRYASTLLKETTNGLAAATVSGPCGVSGQVLAPESFEGTIFIGLYRTPIPQGDPEAGTVVTRPGPYHISGVRDGHYFILAAGLTWSNDPRDYFLYERALRGGGQSILVRNGSALGCTEVTLRPPGVFDPPILVTLPLLLAGNGNGSSALRSISNRLSKESC